MNPEQAREPVRLTLTTLAHDARHALSHEDYEEALGTAERLVMTVVYDCWRSPAVAPGTQPREGTWTFVRSHADTRPGYYQLMDNAGRLVGVVAQTHGGSWECFFQPDTIPIEKEQ